MSLHPNPIAPLPNAQNVIYISAPTQENVLAIYNGAMLADATNPVNKEAVVARVKGQGRTDGVVGFLTFYTYLDYKNAMIAARTVDKPQGTVIGPLTRGGVYLRQCYDISLAQRGASPTTASTSPSPAPMKDEPVVEGELGDMVWHQVKVEHDEERLGDGDEMDMDAEQFVEESAKRAENVAVEDDSMAEEDSAMDEETTTGDESGSADESGSTDESGSGDDSMTGTENDTTEESSTEDESDTGNESATRGAFERVTQQTTSDEEEEEEDSEQVEVGAMEGDEDERMDVDEIAHAEQHGAQPTDEDHTDSDEHVGEQSVEADEARLGVQGDVESLAEDEPQLMEEDADQRSEEDEDEHGDFEAVNGEPDVAALGQPRKRSLDDVDVDSQEEDTPSRKIRRLKGAVREAVSIAEERRREKLVVQLAAKKEEARHADEMTKERSATMKIEADAAARITRLSEDGRLDREHEADEEAAEREPNMMRFLAVLNNA